MLKIILLAKQYKILRYEDVTMKFKKHNIFWVLWPNLPSTHVYFSTDV